jgi:hypothetical protein
LYIDSLFRRQKRDRPCGLSPLIIDRIFSSDLCAEILDVDISAETGVIGQIEAFMIRIFVDHDVVAVP